MKHLRLTPIVINNNEGTTNITFSDLTSLLDKNSYNYSVLPLSKQSSIIILENGGRILGPFSSSTSNSILWMNKWWDNFASSPPNWNIGGERLWIAPELRYCIKNRKDIKSSYFLPKDMDPANYQLSTTSDAVILKTRMHLRPSDHPTEIQTLSVRRDIKSLSNPLRTLSDSEDLMKNTVFSGYSHVVNLIAENNNPLPSEPWSIMQVRQGGKSIIPVYSNPKVGWYYTPKQKNIIHFFPYHIITEHPSNSLYKIGINACSCTGRVGYYFEDHQTTLIIRNFMVSPSNMYQEEPFDSPGDKGYAFHLYNSESITEQFSEIECHGISVGDKPLDKESTSIFESYFFQGKKEQIRQIAHILLSYKETNL